MLSDEEKQRDAALAPLATSIVNAYPNWNGFFSSLVANYSPDGKRIVFGSVRDGVPEIYLADRQSPRRRPKAVTTGADRAIWAAFTPDGKSVLFLRDDKGDENHAIWRVNVDGSGLVNLTPGEKFQRGEPIVPSKKPRTMFYGRRTTSALGMSVVMQGLRRAQGRLFGAWLRRARRRHRGRLLASDARSIAFGDDPAGPPTSATGQTCSSTRPREGPSAWTSAAFSSDGKRVFITTDEGAESSVLLSLDAATGKELGRYTNAPATAAMTLAVAQKGDRLRGAERPRQPRRSTDLRRQDAEGDYAGQGPPRGRPARFLHRRRPVVQPARCVPCRANPPTCGASLRLRPGRSASPQRRAPRARRARTDRHDDRNGEGVRRPCDSGEPLPPEIQTPEEAPTTSSSSTAGQRPATRSAGTRTRGSFSPSATQCSSRTSAARRASGARTRWRINCE